MKKYTFTLILILLIGSTVFAQRKGSTINWLSIAVRGGYGVSSLLNMDTFEDKNIEPNYLTGSYFVGGRFGWTYGDYIGLTFEVDYTSFGQEYNIRVATDYVSKTVNIKSLDLIPMLRVTTPTGFFIEVGPKFSTLKKIEENPTIDLAFYPGGLTSVYQPKYTSAVLSLGFLPLITDRLTLGLGIRANYGWSSIVADNNYFAVTDDGRYAPSTLYTDSKTNAIQLHAFLDFNYFFGFFGDATCGRGRLMLFQ